MSISVESIIAALHKHKNVLLYGPPGTGKSHLMNEVAKSFALKSTPSGAGSMLSVDTDSEHTPLVLTPSNVTTRWVTFHQGYSYEDFVLGLKPQSASAGQFSLIPKPGVLLELSAAASDGAGLLLIDEINRGNTSRIFGEFITLMEPDKRLDISGNQTSMTVKITLPYLSPEEKIVINTASGNKEISREFCMPSEVYTLASMNSVDKSIAPMDTALRRRFHIINLFPSSSDIEGALSLSSGASLKLDPINEIASANGVARLAAAVMNKLNRSIGLYLGPEFMLGQWYLQNFPLADFESSKNALAEIWLYRILPQLIELFHGRTDTLIGLFAIDSEYGLSMVEATPSEIENGALSYLWTTSPTPSVGQIIYSLQIFVESPKSISAISETVNLAHEQADAKENN